MSSQEIQSKIIEFRKQKKQLQDNKGYCLGFICVCIAHLLMAILIGDMDNLICFSSLAINIIITLFCFWRNVMINNNIKSIENDLTVVKNEMAVAGDYLGLISFYLRCGIKENDQHIRDLKIKYAEQREAAFDYQSALAIWEELVDIERAKAVRKKIQKINKVDGVQKVVYGDEITTTTIQDSVVSRSQVGTKAEYDDILTKIEKLNELKQNGSLSEDEFIKAKEKLLR